MHHAEHYSMLQPRFEQLEKTVRPRDRYRATRRDDVEDEDGFGEEGGFDSFDEKLLRMPYDDRQRQAAQGRARLSLAPGGGKGSEVVAMGMRSMWAVAFDFAAMV